MKCFEDEKLRDIIISNDDIMAKYFLKEYEEIKGDKKLIY